MLLLSIYMSMLLSNWTILYVIKNYNSTLAWSSFFIKVFIMALSHILYLIVLIFHKVFPERTRFV